MGKLDRREDPAQAPPPVDSITPSAADSAVLPREPEELAALEMRSPEVASLFAYLERGGPVYPLSILADERSPLRA